MHFLDPFFSISLSFDKSIPYIPYHVLWLVILCLTAVLSQFTELAIAGEQDVGKLCTTGKWDVWLTLDGV